MCTSTSTSGDATERWDTTRLGHDGANYDEVRPAITTTTPGDNMADPDVHDNVNVGRRNGTLGHDEAGA
jgi:hypothetical protein